MSAWCRGEIILHRFLGEVRPYLTADSTGPYPGGTPDSTAPFAALEGALRAMGPRDDDDATLTVMFHAAIEEALPGDVVAHARTVFASTMMRCVRCDPPTPPEGPVVDQDVVAAVQDALRWAAAKEAARAAARLSYREEVAGGVEALEQERARALEEARRRDMALLDSELRTTVRIDVNVGSDADLVRPGKRPPSNQDADLWDHR